MATEDVKKAIRHGRKVIKDHGDGNILHESGTRYAVIDPILRALGWKLDNPQQCRVEEWRILDNQQRVADYVLFNRVGQAVVLIEAKGFSKTKLNGWKEENQLRDYALGHAEAKLAVLTNGAVWYFYKSSNPGEFNFGEARPYDVDIIDGKTEQTARKLMRELNKRQWW